MIGHSDCSSLSRTPQLPFKVNPKPWPDPKGNSVLKLLMKDDRCRVSRYTLQAQGGLHGLQQGQTYLCDALRVEVVQMIPGDTACNHGPTQTYL